MAQKKYSVVCNDNGAAAPQTLLELLGSATVRPRISEFDVGSNSTPADQSATIVLGRFTVVGTGGSAPTPTPLDAQEVAAVSTANIARTAEPTYAATFLYTIALNQRASWRWVAAPDYEFICTAGAATGLGLKRNAQTGTFTSIGTVFFFE